MESRHSLYENTHVIFEKLGEEIEKAKKKGKTNIILLAGFPGAGKSTIIAELCEYIPFFLISGDKEPSVSCERITDQIFNCQNHKQLIEEMVKDINSLDPRLGKEPILIDKPFVSNVKTDGIDTPEIYHWLDALNNRFPNAKIYIIYLDIPWDKAHSQAWTRFNNDNSRGIIPRHVYEKYDEIAENLYRKEKPEILQERKQYDITLIKLKHTSTTGGKRKRKTKRKTKHKIRKNKKTRRINHRNRK